jgi:hypothetical protein
MTVADTLALLDWKRRVFSLYAAVRALEPAAGCELWRSSAAHKRCAFPFRCLDKG